MSEPSKKYLGLLNQRARRLQTLLDHLADYLRAGEKQYELRVVHSRQLIEEVCDLIRLPPNFVVEVSDGLPVLTTFVAPLRQIFLNLIGNAIKHHDKAVGKIVVSANEAAEAVLFTVSDDGPGIDPQYHEKVFDCFRRLVHEEEEGSGLGLALTLRLVQQCGGLVWAESTPGEGAAFKFTWPWRVERCVRGTSDPLLSDRRRDEPDGERHQL